MPVNLGVWGRAPAQLQFHSILAAVTGDFKHRYFSYGIVKMTEIIGEAAYKLTDEFKDSHPEVPWNVIKGMRHYLVHEYYQVSKESIWDTLTKDLPDLRPFIIKYLEELS